MSIFLDAITPGRQETIENFKTALNSDDPKCVIQERKYDKLAKNNEVDDEGNSPLHHACRIGELKIVEWALNSESNTSLQNNAKETPLMHLFTCKQTLVPHEKMQPIVEALLGRMKKRDVNSVNSENRTALHFAAKAGATYLKIYKAIEAAGGNPAIADQAGQTPSYLLASAFSSFVQDIDLDRDLINLSSERMKKLKKKQDLEEELEQVEEVNEQCKQSIEKYGELFETNRDAAFQGYEEAEESAKRAEKAKEEAEKAKQEAEKATHLADRLDKRRSSTQRRRRRTAAVLDLKQQEAADAKDRLQAIEGTIGFYKKQEVNKTAELAALTERLAKLHTQIDDKKTGISELLTKDESMNGVQQTMVAQRVHIKKKFKSRKSRSAIYARADE